MDRPAAARRNDQEPQGHRIHADRFRQKAVAVSDACAEVYARLGSVCAAGQREQQSRISAFPYLLERN